MKTRRGLCYPKLTTTTTITSSAAAATTTTNSLSFAKSGGCDRVCTRKFRSYEEDFPHQKRSRISPKMAESGGYCDADGPDYFDSLPDDLIVSILAKLGSSASCPADFINALITCKRFNGLCLYSMVLSKLSSKIFLIEAESWSESSHKFLKLCSDYGNVEASYTLGMIRFYCLQNRGSGASLLAKAAIKSHSPSLYALAVIQFNGSGGTKSDKDLRAGVALCARAAFLGHVDALRELGHCLQDGYGVKQNVAEGRRFLVQANARELAASLTCAANLASAPSWLLSKTTSKSNIGGVRVGGGGDGVCPLLSDFGCNVPEPEAHPANKFMTEWWSGRVLGLGLRLCSHTRCGRSETRRHEFRRCSVCGTVSYCSRACQALDWKLRHKIECAPMPPRWAAVGGAGGQGFNDGELMEDMGLDDGEFHGGES